MARRHATSKESLRLPVQRRFARIIRELNFSCGKYQRFGVLGEPGTVEIEARKLAPKVLIMEESLMMCNAPNQW